MVQHNPTGAFPYITPDLVENAIGKGAANLVQRKLVLVAHCADLRVSKQGGYCSTSNSDTIHDGSASIFIPMTLGRGKARSSHQRNKERTDAIQHDRPHRHPNKALNQQHTINPIRDIIPFFVKNDVPTNTNPNVHPNGEVILGMAVNFDESNVQGPAGDGTAGCDTTPDRYRKRGGDTVRKDAVNELGQTPNDQPPRTAVRNGNDDVLPRAERRSSPPGYDG